MTAKCPRCLCTSLHCNCDVYPQPAPVAWRHRNYATDPWLYSTEEPVRASPKARGAYIPHDAEIEPLYACPTDHLPDVPQESSKPILHTHDAASRAAIDKACGEIAMVLSDRDIWRAPWRVEVDGCVFKFKIDGYPKNGTPKAAARQKYLDELADEADAYEASPLSRPHDRTGEA